MFILCKFFRYWFSSNYCACNMSFIFQLTILEEKLKSVKDFQTWKLNYWSDNWKRKQLCRWGCHGHFTFEKLKQAMWPNINVLISYFSRTLETGHFHHLPVTNGKFAYNSLLISLLQTMLYLITIDKRKHSRYFAWDNFHIRL